VKGVGRELIGVGTAAGRAGVDRETGAGFAPAVAVAPPVRRLSRFLRDKISLRFPGRTSILTTNEVRDRFTTVTGGGG